MQRLMLIPTGFGVGLTASCLGLIRLLQRAGLKVGYFKPIAQHNDATATLITRTHHLQAPAPLTLSQADAYLAGDELDELLEALVSLEAEIDPTLDVLIIEGLVPSAEVAYAARLNSKLAKSLDAAAILIATPAEQSPAVLAERVAIQAKLLEGVEVAGVLLNKVDPAKCDALNSAFAHTQLPILGSVPWHSPLNAPRTQDIAQALELNTLNHGALCERRVQQVLLCASGTAHLASQMQAGTLVLVPAERPEALLTACLAGMNGVPLAGVVLCAAQISNEALLSLCQPALAAGLPLLASDKPCTELFLAYNRLKLHIAPDDQVRAEQVSDFVADYLNAAPLLKRLGHRRAKRLSPAAFRYQLVQRAKAANKRIVLPEGAEPRTIAAAVICQSRGIARCVLLAKAEQVQAVALAQGLKLPEGLEIIDPEQVRERYVAPMVELRKGKGLNAPMARAQLEDNVVLGTMMLALDEVDGLVSGAIHTTANTIRPALQLIKTAPGFSLVSSVFFMLLPDQVLVYGDCAVNPDPSAEQLAEIALQSAHSAKAFGIEPKVAMLSYSTGSSGEGADVAKVHQATLIAQARAPEVLIDGPLQYDAASVSSVGLQKAPNSLVAGQATVFVFPDLNTGNTTYKAVQRSAHCVSVGPMLQGLRKPVNDLSRGALVDDIVFTIALTAIQALDSVKN